WPYPYDGPIAVDQAGHVYLGGRSTVDIYTLSGASVTSLSVDNRGLVMPTQVEVDAAGNVYVLDQEHTRVVHFDAAGTAVAQLRTREVVASDGLAIGPDGLVHVSGYVVQPTGITQDAIETFTPD